MQASIVCLQFNLLRRPCNNKYHMASQLVGRWNGDNNRVSTLEKWRQMPDGLKPLMPDLYIGISPTLHFTNMLHCTSLYCLTLELSLGGKYNI